MEDSNTDGPTAWAALIVGGDESVQATLTELGIGWTLVERAEDLSAAYDSIVHRLVVWASKSRPGTYLADIRSKSDGYTVIALVPKVARSLDWSGMGVDYLLRNEGLSKTLSRAVRHAALAADATGQRLELDRVRQSLESSNENLRFASRRFETLFNCLPVACFTFDLFGHVHEWNNSAEHAFGYSSFRAFLNPVWDLLGGDGFWSPDVVRAVLADEPILGREWSLAMPSGDVRHFVCSIYPLRNSEGTITGAVCANADITERKLAQRRNDDQLATINRYAQELAIQKQALEQANARLNELAETDGLTGLRNRRALGTSLDAALASLSPDQPLSVIMLDVDHFKQYNDRFGHVAGDEVLRSVAQILTQQSRPREYAARYGGEEFALVLFGADEVQATKAAERFRRAIESFGWTEAPVTASFGVATTRGKVSQTELIELADAALYASKRLGRNRVTHSSSQQTRAA